jgi:hypothetical protein
MVAPTVNPGRATTCPWPAAPVAVAEANVDHARDRHVDGAAGSEEGGAPVGWGVGVRVAADLEDAWARGAVT